MKVKYENVSFNYNPTAALSNVSCEFDSGKTVVVAGHNGSGKSTFLKLMNGILKPTEGRVTLGEIGTEGKRTSELARLCALSFQNPDDQLFAQTVKKELRFGIDNIGGGDGLYDSIVDTFHLSEHLYSNPYALVYAMRRLVVIGATATMGTPILALDEPTAGLSIREKGYLGNLISFLKAKGTTVVIVTHDLNFLLPYSDEMLLLSHGEVQFSGGRDEFFTRKDARDVMRRSGIGYPMYARISSALDLGKTAFDAEEIVEGVGKKRAGTTRRTNGQHQLEGV